MLTYSDLPQGVVDNLRRGTVIPAHPLALDDARRFDSVRQRALTRYYLDAGVGGLAIGVHTTQFAIRDVGLFRPVLETAAATVADWTSAPVAMIAGICGQTAQAVEEAKIAAKLGYHAGLVSLSAFAKANDDERLAHCRAVADILPVFGFYLQPAVGGIALGRSFWRRFAEIENVIGIKVAPFNRYSTLDVVHGVIDAGAEARVLLYTGNDDHIVLDLLQPFPVRRNGEPVTMRMRGGLLGHWSVWTKSAVTLLSRIQAAGPNDLPALLALDAAVTDCNAAIFDVANSFHGVIAGCHEVLRRQGLLEGIWCLDPAEGLSPGQAEEITRVSEAYPELTDDAFVAANLDRWLSDR